MYSEAADFPINSLSSQKMEMKKLLLQVICAPLLLMVSCKHSSTLTGAKNKIDKCNGTAGYQWSSLKKECIRVFEQPIQLTSVAKEPMESICAVIFDEKKEKVELFLSNPIILTKKNTDNFEGTFRSTFYQLHINSGKWQLLIDGKVAFSE